jgi:hypothetical protein
LKAWPNQINGEKSKVCILVDKQYVTRDFSNKTKDILVAAGLVRLLVFLPDLLAPPLVGIKVIDLGFKKNCSAVVHSLNL